MKYVISFIFALSVFAVQAKEPDVVHEEVSVKCNWGLLTMESIADGFPQGPHVSDPSGDGKGKGDADSPRKGLGNVIERGNLQATCEFIESLLQ